MDREERMPIPLTHVVKSHRSEERSDTLSLLLFDASERRSPCGSNESLKGLSKARNQ